MNKDSSKSSLYCIEKIQPQIVDTVAEWLTRQPAKLLPFGRVSSNLTGVVFLTSSIYYYLFEIIIENILFKYCITNHLLALGILITTRTPISS